MYSAGIGTVGLPSDSATKAAESDSILRSDCYSMEDSPELWEAYPCVPVCAQRADSGCAVRLGYSVDSVESRRGDCHWTSAGHGS